jgi:V/A-type H+-transporting ATPase subunit B
MMDLKVNVSLEAALDNGWKILSECFSPDETNFRSELIEKFWPKEEKHSNEP